MIDSVSLTRQVRMHSPREMLSLGFRSACQHPSELCTHRARWKLPGGDKKPHLTWSEAPNGSHWLSLTGSLQKFMFGSNVYPLSSDDEIRACIEGTSQYVQSVAQVSFDSFRAYVTRVDYCHDWRMTSGLVTQYLWALRGISLPRMHKTLFDNCTIQLGNASQTVCFYDKFKERSAMKSNSVEELAAAKGLLRFEMRLRDNRACERHVERLGVMDRTVQSMLTSDVARRTISNTLERLGVDKPLSSGSKRLELLRSHFADDRAKVIRLAGFLAMCDQYGSQNLVDLGICSYTDYRRKLADVKAAGALFVTDGPRSLAPLTIVQELPSAEGSAAA